jgi:hypothetical protein
MPDPLDVLPLLVPLPAAPEVPGEAEPLDAALPLPARPPEPPLLSTPPFPLHASINTADAMPAAAIQVRISRPRTLARPNIRILDTLGSIILASSKHRVRWRALCLTLVPQGARARRLSDCG